MKVNKKKRAGATTLLLILVFLAGLSLLLYPTVSNWWNSRYHAQAIDDYTQVVSDMKNETYEELWASARAFNEELYDRGGYNLDDDLLEQYKSLLNVSGAGVMGYIEIPSINSTLPIYHGTDESVLQVALGHLEWTSLPVGGESTHSVVSGHRGLPSAELLTHIDRLEQGDKFYIHVLNETLEYRVCDIFVVLPEDTSKLQIVEGKDYMTLVTCTPYGVNSHRLLVRGERVHSDRVSETGQLYLNNEIKEIHLMYVIPVVMVAVVLMTGLAIWIQEKRAAYQKKRRQERRMRRRAQQRREDAWSNDSENG